MSAEAWLITRSCTTGWADWIHGDLWFTPDALVRLRLGVLATIVHGSSSTLEQPRSEDAREPMFGREQVLTAHRTNKYLYLSDMASASLRRGVLTSRLNIRTYTGQRHKLLWLAADPAYVALWELLPEVLGDRFTLG